MGNENIKSAIEENKEEKFILPNDCKLIGSYFDTVTHKLQSHVYKDAQENHYIININGGLINKY